MRLRPAASAVVACTLMAVTAHADERARHAYAAGNFMAAAALAEGGADGSLAARALLAEAVTSETGAIDPLIARAETNARAALARTDSVDARLQLALALGLKARRAPLGEALRQGYAREGRALIDAALARAPSNAWAHALRGAWHLEIVRRGGRAGAALYGARIETGVASFERARALAPDDAAIAYQYAVALLERDDSADRASVAALLDAAGQCAARDAFETAITREARRVGTVLAAEGPAAARRAATARFD